MLIKLLPQYAPKHVERIQQLVRDGAYDNISFHRVIPGFMAQTGDVQHGYKDHYNHQHVGTGKSHYKDLYAELSELPFEAGIVAMARGRYIHSANSQFFIMTAHNPNLDGRYTVIGLVLEGLETIKSLEIGRSGEDKGKVVNPDYIRKASLLTQ